MEGYRDFILVSNSNHTSVLHRFRFNQVFPLAGNDGTVLSPQDGAAAELFVRNLRERKQRLILFIVTIRLSCTVSDKIKFHRLPEMTS